MTRMGFTMWIIVVVAVIAIVNSASTLGAQDEGRMQLFLVSAPSAAALAVVLDSVDIWRISRLRNDVQAEVLATEQTMATLVDQPGLQAINLRMRRPGTHRGLLAEPGAVKIKALPFDPLAELAASHDRRAVCAHQTRGYLALLDREDFRSARAPYTTSAFFDCWRTTDEIDEFLETLAMKHPDIMTRLPKIATTAIGHPIPAYRLSANATSSEHHKRAIYLQGIIHAREWQGGSSVVYALVAMLDGLRSSNEAIRSVSVHPNCV